MYYQMFNKRREDYETVKLFGYHRVYTDNRWRP